MGGRDDRAVVVEDHPIFRKRLVQVIDAAPELQLSVRTVHSHLDRIRNKTGSRRRADLTRFALERGIVPRSPKEG